MTDITGFEKVAKHLTRPLVLIGFVLMLIFGIHKLIVQSGLLPQVTQQAGGEIIKLILQYGFWLGLVVAVLGFGHSVLTSYLEKKLLSTYVRPAY